MAIEKAARGEEAFGGTTRRIETESFQAAEQILPVSAEIRDQIVGYGIAPDKVIVTPNAVDLDLFTPADPPRDDPGSFVIGTVNSMRAYHGMGTLLRAAALLKDEIPGLRLLLIGDGPLLRENRELTRALGLEQQVEFTGTLDHARVPERLRECDVCVSPNEGEANQYNCPMKLFEYMALNIPIVAADWGDIPNIIRHGETGLLHAPGDPASLAARLKEVWQHRDRARQLAARAREVAERRTWRAIARRILTDAGTTPRPGPDCLSRSVHQEAATTSPLMESPR